MSKNQLQEEFNGGGSIYGGKWTDDVMGQDPSPYRIVLKSKPEISKGYILIIMP